MIISDRGKCTIEEHSSGLVHSEIFLVVEENKTIDGSHGRYRLDHAADLMTKPTSLPLIAP